MRIHISDTIARIKIPFYAKCGLGVTYSYLKYGVFITTKFDAMQIGIHCDCSWSITKFYIFTPFYVGVGQISDAVCLNG